MKAGKAILVGSTGVLGSEVMKLLRGRGWTVVTVNRHSGDYKVDMSEEAAVESMFRSVGPFDALIAASGEGAWGTIDSLQSDDYRRSLASKLMGQVNLVTVGRSYAAPGACFVLTSGVLAHQPMPGGLAMSVVNAGIEAFVRGAALEMPGARVNAVSPSFAKETMEKMGLDSSTGTPAVKFAELYLRALEEGATGKIYEL